MPNGPNTRTRVERRDQDRRLSDDDYEALRSRIKEDVVGEIKIMAERFALRALVVILGTSGGTATFWHFIEKVMAEAK